MKQKLLPELLSAAVVLTCGIILLEAAALVAIVGYHILWWLLLQ
jgi:hypothetical protein